MQTDSCINFSFTKETSIWIGFRFSGVEQRTLKYICIYTMDMCTKKYTDRFIYMFTLNTYMYMCVLQCAIVCCSALQ